MPLFKPNNTDASIYDKTAFTNLDNALKLLEGDSKTIIDNLNNDAAYQYAKPLIMEFYTNYEPQFQRLNTEINALQTQYMKALMDVMPEERLFSRCQQHASRYLWKGKWLCTKGLRCITIQ